jgi:hypothetical protein
MTKQFLSLTLAAIAAAGALGSLEAQPPPMCGLGNAIMNGTYAVAGTGTVVGVGPIATVGIVLYNGDGTGVSQFSTSSVNGGTSTSSKVPAVFTVNPDCTGFKTIGTTHFNFVITPDGATINWIVTDAGVTMTGTGIRMKR